MTPDAAKLKCQNFFVTLLRLTRKERPKLVATNVQKLIQCLIDAEIEPEVFTTNLQWVLNTSPQSCLIPFLKVDLDNILKGYYIINVNIYRWVYLI